MTNEKLSLRQQALPGGRRGRKRRDDRKVMNRIFLDPGTGIPWRDLPDCCGSCTTCCNRWGKSEEWLAILERRQSVMVENDDRDGDGANALQRRMIDSSAVRVHRHAAGSPVHGEPVQLGRSRWRMGRGGRRPLFPAPGQVSVHTAAETVPADIEAGMTVIAGKACDTTAVLDHLAEVGATAVFPSVRNRTEARMLATEAHATRKPVERFNARIREYQRVVNRYEKRARNLLSAAILSATHHPMCGLARATV